MTRHYQTNVLRCGCRIKRTLTGREPGVKTWGTLEVGAVVELYSCARHTEAEKGWGIPITDIDTLAARVEAEESGEASS